MCPVTSQGRGKLAGVPELIIADFLAVAIQAIAADRGVRQKHTGVEHADVGGAKVQIIALARIQTLHALVANFISRGSCAHAGARARRVSTIGVGGARTSLLRPTYAPLTDRRSAHDTLIGRGSTMTTRFGAVAELTVVAVRVILALNATPLAEFAAETEASPARSAIRIGRTCGPGRGS